MHQVSVQLGKAKTELALDLATAGSCSGAGRIVPRKNAAGVLRALLQACASDSPAAEAAAAAANGSKGHVAKLAIRFRATEDDAPLFGDEECGVAASVAPPQGSVYTLSSPELPTLLARAGVWDVRGEGGSAKKVAKLAFSRDCVDGDRPAELWLLGDAHCLICGELEEGDKSIVMCDGCNRAYHETCYLEACSSAGCAPEGGAQRPTDLESWLCPCCDLNASGDHPLAASAAAHPPPCWVCGSACQEEGDRDAVSCIGCHRHFCGDCGEGARYVQRLDPAGPVCLCHSCLHQPAAEKRLRALGSHPEASNRPPPAAVDAALALYDARDADAAAAARDTGLALPAPGASGAAPLQDLTLSSSDDVGEAPPAALPFSSTQRTNPTVPVAAANGAKRASKSPRVSKRAADESPASGSTRRPGGQSRDTVSPPPPKRARAEAPMRPLGRPSPLGVPSPVPPELLGTPPAGAERHGPRDNGAGGLGSLLAVGSPAAGVQAADDRALSPEPAPPVPRNEGDAAAGPPGTPPPLQRTTRYSLGWVSAEEPEGGPASRAAGGAAATDRANASVDLRGGGGGASARASGGDDGQAAADPPALGGKVDHQLHRGDADRSPDRSSDDVVEMQGQHNFNSAPALPGAPRMDHADASRSWSNGMLELSAEAVIKHPRLQLPGGAAVYPASPSQPAWQRDLGGGAPPSSHDAAHALTAPTRPFALKRKTLQPKSLPPLYGSTEDSRPADAQGGALGEAPAKAPGSAVGPSVPKQTRPKEKATRPKRDRRTTSRLKESVSEERGKEPLYRCRTCGQEKPMKAYDRSTKHTEDREPSCLECLGKTARKRVTFTSGTKRGRAHKAGASRSDASLESDSDGEPEAREAPAERDAASTLLQLGQRPLGAAGGTGAAAASGRPAGGSERPRAPPRRGIGPPPAPPPDAVGAALGMLDALKGSLLEMQSAMQPGEEAAGSEDAGDDAEGSRRSRELPADLRQVLAIAARPGPLDKAAVAAVITQHMCMTPSASVLARRTQAQQIRQRLGAWRSLLLRLLGVVTEQLHRHESMDLAVDQYTHAMNMLGHVREAR